MKTVIKAIRNGKLVYTDELRGFFLEKSQNGDWEDASLMFDLPNAEELVLAYLKNGHRLPDKCCVSEELCDAIGRNPQYTEILDGMLSSLDLAELDDNEVKNLIKLISRLPNRVEYYAKILQNCECDRFCLFRILENNFNSFDDEAKFISQTEIEQIVKINLELENFSGMSVIFEVAMLKCYPDMVDNYIAMYGLEDEAEALFFADQEHFTDNQRRKYICSYAYLEPETRKVLLQREDAQNWVELYEKNADKNDAKEFRKEYAKTHQPKRKWPLSLFK